MYDINQDGVLTDRLDETLGLIPVGAGRCTMLQLSDTLGFSSLQLLSAKERSLAEPSDCLCGNRFLRQDLCVTGVRRNFHNLRNLQSQKKRVERMRHSCHNKHYERRY